MSALLALQCIGGVAVTAAAYAAFQLGLALASHCDTRTRCAHALQPPDYWRGRVVWITGASSGLGEELARQLGDAGARLILSARRREVRARGEALSEMWNTGSTKQKHSGRE